MTAPVPAALATQIGLPEGFGIVVEELVPDSPAAAAGVQRYDVLKAINDQQLVDPNQLAVLVRSYGKDKEVSLTILRKGQEQKLTLKIGERLLPERRPITIPLPPEFVPRLDNLRERTEDAVRKLQENLRPEEWRERGEEVARKMQEHMRGFQERVRDYQQKIEEWRKNPGTSAPPEPPKFDLPVPPRPPGPPDRPGASGSAPASPSSGNLRPGTRIDGRSTVKVDDGGVTIWDTAQARVVVKDETGELTINSENGKRIATAKDPAGAVIFTGPIDTEEQRQALPEPIRKKLANIRVRNDSTSSAQVRRSDESERRASPRLEREIQ
jgi:PDZ domain